MKIRISKDENYKGIFHEGNTFRIKLDPSKPILSLKNPEIEDVAINNLCNAGCPYCYTSAKKSGINFPDILKKANEVWDHPDKPFQIAIGGAGEATLHPDFPDFLKEVKNLDILPNYTTSGLNLTERVLQATEDFSGGVALSYHPHLSNFDISFKKLSELRGKIKLNIHVIVGQEGSLESLEDLYKKYSKNLDYIVLLPYQPVGRAKEVPLDFKSLFEWVTKVGFGKFALGALFYEYLLKNPINDIETYEPEIFSGYRIFDDSYKEIRYSSYNLKYKNEKLFLENR